MALGLGALTILIGLGQWTALAIARRQRRGFSFIPFIPASLGTVACVLAPWHGSGWLLPLVFVLDPTPVMFLFVLLTGRLSKDAV
jgi:hypothetical protein